MSECACLGTCPCHAPLSNLERVRRAGIPIGRASKREAELLVALLPAGTRHAPDTLAERLYGDLDDPLHVFRMVVSRARLRLPAGWSIGTQPGAIWVCPELAAAKAVPGSGANRRVHGHEAAGRVRALLAAGWRQKDAAARVGVPRSVVSQIKRGEHWTDRERSVAS